jgi:hypothetical protein
MIKRSPKIVCKYNRAHTRINMRMNGTGNDLSRMATEIVKALITEFPGQITPEAFLK